MKDYNKSREIKKSNILVTGGAGFIGSNIVKELLNHPYVEKVRVLDNLSTGNKNNLESFMSNPKFDFLWGDIRDVSTCLAACKNMDKITHQAALGSIPRSISDPISTNNVNISGTLNIFIAAKENGIKRVVYAASSSTYGDSKELPKKENNIGQPISPYAITKLVNELYANVLGDIYDMEFIGLRYFNVFGPNQDPYGAYAAVIPLFFKAIIEQRSPKINGDGTQSRDFTYVDNAVHANIRGLFTENPDAYNQVYNIAFGDSLTIIELFNFLKKLSDSTVKAIYGPERPGDVKHSLADISKAKKLLKYQPTISAQIGLKKAYKWYMKNLDRNKTSEEVL